MSENSYANIIFITFVGNCRYMFFCAYLGVLLRLVVAAICEIVNIGKYDDSRK